MVILPPSFTSSLTSLLALAMCDDPVEPIYVSLRVPPAAPIVPSPCTADSIEDVLDEHVVSPGMPVTVIGLEMILYGFSPRDMRLLLLSIKTSDGMVAILLLKHLIEFFLF